MDWLSARAPKTVVIDGVDYEITTNFRECLDTIKHLKDPNFDLAEKAEILINNMYQVDPPNVNGAVKAALWFLRGGEEYKERDLPNLCDFEQDIRYIINSFMKTGIDLYSTDYMHWWVFMARFSELPESAFSRIVYLRSQAQRGKLTLEEWRECKRLGDDVIEIKVPETDEERQERELIEGWFNNGKYSNSY